MAMTSVPGIRICNEKGIGASHKLWLFCFVLCIHFMIYGRTKNNNLSKITLLMGARQAARVRGKGGESKENQRRCEIIFRINFSRLSVYVYVGVGVCVWVGKVCLCWYAACRFEQMLTKLEKWKIGCRRALHFIHLWILVLAEGFDADKGTKAALHKLHIQIIYIIYHESTCW